MNVNTKDDRKTSFILEEYRQCYEHIRNNIRAADNKEAIFTVAAFGIIALAISKDFSLGYIVGAMFVSIAFYFYQIIACERISFYSGAYIERLKEIEGEINEPMDKANIRLQTKLKEDYEEKARNQHIRWIRERSMRRILAIILVFLWGVIIGIKISESDRTRLKTWHHHKQTKYHRFIR